MCGIVGVLGSHEAAPILVDALKRLEYRGYDSAGIATAHNGAINRRRAVGKLAELSDVLVHDPLVGKAGIGHTRWATHGEPSVKNARTKKNKSQWSIMALSKISASFARNWQTTTCIPKRTRIPKPLRC